VFPILGSAQNRRVTKQEFVAAYQTCSELIHTTNPYSQKSRLDLKHLSRTFFDWHHQVITLLNLHELHLYNDPGMAVCSMNDGGTNIVRVYRFAPPALANKTKP